MTFHVPELYRFQTDLPLLASSPADGNNGCFDLPGLVLEFRRLFVVASDGEGWEHVSVHAHHAITGDEWTPTWYEMCHVVNLFWDPEDVVVEYHPRHSQYRNVHPHTLHAWRPIGVELPTPPPDMVAPDLQGAPHAA